MRSRIPIAPLQQSLDNGRNRVSSLLDAIAEATKLCYCQLAKRLSYKPPVDVWLERLVD